MFVYSYDDHTLLSLSESESDASRSKNFLLSKIADTTDDPKVLARRFFSAAIACLSSKLTFRKVLLRLLIESNKLCLSLPMMLLLLLLLLL
jgi:hypothetical protein